MIRYDGIDAEHVRLVDIVNTCAIQVSRGQTEAAVDRLEEFLAAMVEHFAHEEREMAELKYHGLAWHEEHHRECLRRTRELLDDSRRRGIIDDEVLDELFDSIVMDIAKADLKFCEFLEGIGKV